ncbi:MAG TPA: acyl-CoA dehydrogenase family protein [Candidatus Brocadiia bacterium]|nr:acyl-CoA dehydrogenase family protein [Candidatus Brocadiia bacterium]
MSEKTETEPKGCWFLVGDTCPEDIHTREDMTDDDRAMTDTVVSFFENEVVPKMDEIDAQNFDVTVGLLKQAGELGVFMADVPEQYGGLGLSMKNSAGLGEASGMVGAFGVACGAHLGIGMYPIMLFGPDEMKEKYVPKLATAEMIAAFCLTEPGCGCDALSAKSKAVLTEDGQSYIINGTKQFITNGGFADCYTIFAQVNGKLTAFLVTPDMAGFARGPEEHKLGIKGSSTTQIIMTDLKVPASNMIGEIGEGGKIALGILNIGRTKLGLGLVGGSKYAMQVAVKYGLERVQFGQQIIKFPLIKEMLGEISARIYAGESSTWRTAGFIGYIMHGIHSGEMEPGKGLAELAVEAALEKVAQSEHNDYIVDACLQIMGGYGYTSEYPMERAYRDARISRIYEGTNEVCRLVGGGMPFRAAAKGEIPLMEVMERARFRIQTANMDFGCMCGPLGDVEEQLAKMKTIYGYCAGLVFRKYAGAFDKMMEGEEYLGNLHNLAMEIYLTESALLRTKKIMAKNGENEILAALLRIYANYAAGVCSKSLWEVVRAAMTPSQIATVREGLNAVCPFAVVNLLELRRKVADAVIAREGVWPIW